MNGQRALRVGAYGSLAAIGFLVLLGGTLAGCGRKMPPIAPGAYPPPTVKNLTFELKEDVLTIFWPMPAVRLQKESPAAGFKILRARQRASEAECRTCSLRFEVAGEVRSAGQVPSARIQFQDRLEPGYNYRYKVISVSADGIESRESEVVHPTN
jgi:hypothetical protein